MEVDGAQARTGDPRAVGGEMGVEAVPRGFDARLRARPSFRTLYEREGLTEWA